MFGSVVRVLCRCKAYALRFSVPIQPHTHMLWGHDTSVLCVMNIKLNPSIYSVFFSVILQISLPRATRTTSARPRSGVQRLSSLGTANGTTTSVVCTTRSPFLPCSLMVAFLPPDGRRLRPRATLVTSHWMCRVVTCWLRARTPMQLRCFVSIRQTELSRVQIWPLLRVQLTLPSCKTFLAHGVDIVL